jgi:hypothetical protein
MPLLLIAIGAGWGVLVEWISGARVNNALLLPLGLAAAIIVAGTLTTFSGTASAATPLVAVGAAAGLIFFVWPRPVVRSNFSVGFKGRVERLPLPGRWAALGALGAFLAYGAPVLLSGQATFTGYVKLDDTATWFNVVDVVMHHSNSIAALNAAFHPASTFTQVFTGDVGEHYPLGAFMLLGVGRGLTGIDPAWIFTPYLACCAAALALVVYALCEPLLHSPRLQALVAFLAAQSALLYGYSLWGAIKEMTAAFLLALGIALIVPLLRRPPAHLRDLRGMFSLAVAGGALIQTVQVGAGVWVAPALLVLVAAWIVPRLGARTVRAALAAIAGLAAVTAVLILPVWKTLGNFLNHGLPGLLSEGQTRAEDFGNLIQPLSGWQLGGIWPAGDFRITAPAFPTVLFLAVAVIALAVGTWLGVRRRQFGPTLYAVIAPLGCLIIWKAGATPWTVGKSLSIAAPALLAAALTGAAMLWATRRRPPPIAGAAQAAPEAPRSTLKRKPGRPAGLGQQSSWREWGSRHVWVLGVLMMLVLAVGVLWSNVLAYSDVTLAPHQRMAELERIGELVAGKGPTLINEYEAYADRHFLREGAPVGPAEYRPASRPTILRSGALLTKAAWANLDAFPLSTLYAYRSIVTRRDPVESRPPLIYRLVWQGRYYQLWQRPEPAPATILEHIPYGEENLHPYCGNAVGSTTPQPICAFNPVAVPSCPQLLGFARRAARENAHLVAYQRAAPVVTRGDQVVWPRGWYHEEESHSLQPTSPGTAVGHIIIPGSQTYEMFLGGSFDRGFEVRVDGRYVGTVKDQLTGFLSFIPVTKIFLPAGEHTVEYTYPQANLTPGNGETLGMGNNEDVARFTSLAAVALQPLQYPRSELISVSPSEASRLCGRPLEWVEIVANT